MPNVWDLNLYLIESQIVQFNDALSETGLKTRGIDITLPFEGRIFFKVGEPNEPGWAEFVRPSLNSAIPFPSNESISAVLFVRTQAALYAFTFGPGGRFLLKPEAITPDFGKKVVLSIVEPNRIRSADLRTNRAASFQSKLMASKGVQLRTFGIDTQQDFLKAVTGEPMAQFSTLASRVTGADVLQFHSMIKFDQLGARADQFRTAFLGAAYKNVDEFKWIDQLTPVRDTNTLLQLNSLLITTIQQSNFEFGPPDVIDWLNGPSFSFDKNAPQQNRFALTGPDDLLSRFDVAALAALDVDDLQQLKLYCFYANAPTFDLRWSAYECIEAEAVIGQQRYLLSGGHWVAIAPAFLQDIDAYIATLAANAPILPDALSQADINAAGKLDENVYLNRLMTVDPNLAKIHLCPFPTQVNGRAVEFCDVFSPALDLMHFKIWRCSQSFSALAMQATNSAEFLMDNPGFRIQCSAAVTGVKPLIPPVLAADFNPRQYRVVFALIRRQAGTIPFFSRLTLKRQAERVQGRGFKVGFKVIPVI